MNSAVEWRITRDTIAQVDGHEMAGLHIRLGGYDVEGTTITVTAARMLAREILGMTTNSDGALADRPELNGPLPPKTPEGSQNPSADYEHWTCATDHLAAERTIRLIQRTGVSDSEAIEHLASLVDRAGPVAARQALSWEDDVPF